MLTPSKKAKLQFALKAYCKRYLNGSISELDESGTRLMINSFLTDVLGYIPIEEVKTEYMIRGSYADYVIQMRNARHFLVEVKAFSIPLTSGHLRQAVNYGANEGIEWALLTNGKTVELHRIVFSKPIESRRVFSVDLTNPADFKNAVEQIEYLHKDAVLTKSLAELWNKQCALDPANLASLLYAPAVTAFIRRELKEKFKCRFDDEDISSAIKKLINSSVPLDQVKPYRPKPPKKRMPPPPGLAVRIPAAETQPSQS